MSPKDSLGQEDKRLLGILGALALGLCLDGTLRLWPNTGMGEAELNPPNISAIAAPRPQKSDLDALLSLLQPPAAQEPESREETLEESEPAIIEEEQEGILKELFIDRHRFRLRACFEQEGEPPFSALERIDAASNTRTLDRIGEGDTLGPYTVESINHSSLKLSAPGSRYIELRLFEQSPRSGAG